jgi:hypothetical protein
MVRKRQLEIIDAHDARTTGRGRRKPGGGERQGSRIEPEKSDFRGGC